MWSFSSASLHLRHSSFMTPLSSLTTMFDFIKFLWLHIQNYYLNGGSANFPWPSISSIIPFPFHPNPAVFLHSSIALLCKARTTCNSWNLGANFTVASFPELAVSPDNLRLMNSCRLLKRWNQPLLAVKCSFFLLIIIIYFNVALWYFGMNASETERDLLITVLNLK